jgi:predicted oxidoreductase
MADADVIVVGAGLAGLVAACELIDRGRRVLIVDQENANNVGGQTSWGSSNSALGPSSSPAAASAATTTW